MRLQTNADVLSRLSTLEALLAWPCSPDPCTKATKAHQSISWNIKMMKLCSEVNTWLSVNVFRRGFSGSTSLRCWRRSCFLAQQILNTLGERDKIFLPGTRGQFLKKLSSGIATTGRKSCGACIDIICTWAQACTTCPCRAKTSFF